MKSKGIIGIVLTVLFIGMLALAFNIQPVRAEPTTIIVPDDYATVQEAINNANESDTIYVKAGIYYEHVVVNKSVSLIGENRRTTIIDGNGSSIVVDVTVPYVTITGFTIRHGGWGIHPAESHTTITKNIITQNSVGIVRWLGSGVYVLNSTIERNNFTKNGAAINIYISEYNSISYNNISSSGTQGIILYNNANDNAIYGNNFYTHGLKFVSNPGHDNVISENSFYAGGIGGLGADNLIYHNNFFCNYVIPAASASNTWDNGYPSGGNYWNIYNGNDTYSGPHQNETGSDGIGDTPYVGNADNIDRYPLMNPWTPSQPTPVGGIWIPVNKLELLAPYIRLTILLAVAVTTVVYVKKRKGKLK